jgi:hypothetical protein
MTLLVALSMPTTVGRVAPRRKGGNPYVLPRVPFVVSYNPKGLNGFGLVETRTLFVSR